MINNLQELHCSYDVSRLLKDFGFDRSKFVFMDGWFEEDRESREVSPKSYEELTSIMFYNFNEIKRQIVWKPTHAIAHEWIRINFGLYISVYPNSVKLNTFSFSIQGDKPLYYRCINLDCTSPYEAREKGFLHALTKIIKPT